MTLTTTLDEAWADLAKAIDLTEQVVQGIPGAADTLRVAVSNLSLTPGWVKGNLNNDITRAETGLVTEGNKFKTFCECEQDLVQDCRTSVSAAEAYERIDFDELFSQIDVLLREPDWVSDASTLYQTRLRQLDPRARDMREALTTLSEVFRELKSTMNSYWLSVILFLAGTIVSLVGVVSAIATAGPTLGTGAIIGIVGAVIGFLIALAGAFTVPDVHSEVQGKVDRINRIVTDLAEGNDWGERTTHADWDWSSR